MPDSWSITAEWESLGSGSPEERACFAALGIKAHDSWLTEGNDVIANRLRQAPLLSGYHFAEWVAWNWWRLRWEPRSRSDEWAYAHRLSSIGGGYIWPNLTIFSDGERTALISKPTAERPQTPFRYIADCAAVIPAGEFESGIDLFLSQVLERLDWATLRESNLQTIWQSVLEERETPALARARKLEALLGEDPDDSDGRLVQRLLGDIGELSAGAVEELAAEKGHGGKLLTAHDVREVAARSGFDAAPGDAVRLPPGEVPLIDGRTPAWRVGARAAQALRELHGLGDSPVTDQRLAQMAGISGAALSDLRSSSSISFAYDDNSYHGRIVFRSRWPTGRRFELARLLGDRIIRLGRGQLMPATRAYTYRQKVQRSFAAEFLSPFLAVDGMLGYDYSMENQQDVAEYFQVSPLTIRTLLVNHGRLEREDVDDEVEATAA